MTAPSPVPALPVPRFQLSRMLGAGEDGAAYLGRDGGADRVVMHRLSALSDERARELSHRVKLRDLVDGPSFLELLRVDLKGHEPLIVTEAVEGTLASLLQLGGLERDLALKLGLSLARALAAMHRVGMVHGSLCPGCVYIREDLTVALEPVAPRTGSHADDGRFRGAEPQPGQPADIYALGALLGLMLSGAPPAAPDLTATRDSGSVKDEASALAKDLIDPEPSWRPTADDVVFKLAELNDAGAVTNPEVPIPGPRAEPKRLGRFKIEGLLGKGAMGRVYRAVDLADGARVALKMLDGANQSSLSSLRRFRKEARLLSEVKSPYIANLIEMNRDQGQYFMAVELVEGKDLNVLLKEKGPFAESQAVAIAIDLCRALVEVHARGLIHRDLKPANVILLDAPAGGARVKLIDFGIARHIDEHASLQLTEEGASIGTPVYMSPEQCRGDALDAKSDVYSLAVTVFTLVAGQPPFSGGDRPEAIFGRHLFETAPLLESLMPTASRALSMLLARCLEKEPRSRPDIAELLHELEYLGQSEATGITAHPRAPKSDGPVKYRYEWKLKANPEALWAYVSNTDRLNRAIGMGPVEQSFKSVEGEVAQMGKSPSWPFTLAWREHPFEWVHGKRLGVLREMEQGPLRWLRSTVDLEPQAGGGTLLVHTIELEPRGLVGRAAAAVEIGMRVRLALSKVYQRIDELLGQSGDEPTTLADAFEPPHQLNPEQEARLEAIEKRMVDAGADLVATARLGDYLRHAPAQEVARLRPLVLARKLGLDPAQLTVTCLRGAREGSLKLAWDLVCPSCRVPSDIKETLRAVKAHGRCEVCNIDFALDLASSVELVFTVHPEIRAGDRQLYCLSSPGHAPHVFAQVRVKPGERLEVPLQLPEGRYQIVGRRLPFRLEFRVREGAGAARWELKLSKGTSTESGRVMTARQQIVLENDTELEQLVRIERVKGTDDALTAAKIAAQPLFRRLFPGEVLSPGQLVNVSNVAMLMVEVASAPGEEPHSDSGSFAGRYALFRRLEEKAGAQGGSVVKIAGEGVVAVFSDVAGAVRAALAFGDDPLPLRVAVHKGPAAAVTLDEHIDYFGVTVRETSRLLARGGARELVLSEAAASDPAVLPLTAARAARSRVDVLLGVPCQRVPLND